MRRHLAIAAVLTLVTTAVLADMYQDASNAKDPDARRNLRIDTVKSEGGTPPNANSVTRFYNHDGYKQHEIASHTYANEYALEQAGLGAPGGVGVGQGATRVCTAPYSNNQVNCNYVAFGRLGQHRFGNGAGFTTEIINQSTGTTTAWPQLISSDDEIARIWAGGTTNVGLELKAKGTGFVDILNGQGGKLATFLNGYGSANDRYIRFIGGSTAISGDPRIQAFGDGIPDVGLRLLGSGTGGVTFENGNGIIGEFNYVGTGATTNWIELRAGTGTLASLAAKSLSASNVGLYILAQGTGNVILANQDDVDGGNNLASFASSGHGSWPFAFTQQNATGTPGSFGSSGGAFNMYGFRHPMSPQTASNISITIPDTGKHYNNIGSTVTNNFILPQTTATTAGIHYCFHRDAAQVLRITANATDQIAIGATNSALGGTVTSAAGALANFASICLETHRQGQWITVSTPDKTQWTIP